MQRACHDVDLGFETIGNATLICWDRRPVLVTDPWLEGGAYFDSWGLAYEIPEAQRLAALEAPFVWFSHGHPDHLNGASLPLFKGKTILVPDHRGGRIRRDLEALGFKTVVLPDRTWRPLTDRVRVLSIADYNQDAILLVDLDGTLLVDLNDASDRGWGAFVRRTVAKFPRSFLLSLANYGDADMMNLHDEDGRLIPPHAASRFPIGRLIAEKLRTFGIRRFVPFSSLHRYQRSDSLWANAYTATIEDYAREFDPAAGELLPAFIRYDCTKDRFEEIGPDSCAEVVVDALAAGDDWDEPLERGDAEKIEAYFRAFEHLSEVMDFVNVRIGGREVHVPLSGRGFARGVTFEAPRRSFLSAVEHEVFDDLLIGNFVRATLHGSWPTGSLAPDFTPWVAKYGDNGRARSKDELEAYFQDYRRRAPLDYLRCHAEERGKRAFKSRVRSDARLYRLAKKVYWSVRALA